MKKSFAIIILATFFLLAFLLSPPKAWGLVGLPVANNYGEMSISGTSTVVFVEDFEGAFPSVHGSSKWWGRSYENDISPVAGSDEYFYWVGYTPFDSDGDGRNDAVEVKMDVDTTDGTLYVTVYGYLRDPYGNIVDSDYVAWQISGAAVEYGYLYLYASIGSPEGYYDVELHLYDNLGNYEDYRYDNDIAYLYPPGIRVYFYSVDAYGVDDDGNGYHDFVEAKMDVDTSNGAIYVTVYGELYDPNNNYVGSGQSSWWISGTTVEYGYLDITVPQGSQTGWYTLYLNLYYEGVRYDDWSGSVYVNPEPSVGDEYFYSINYIPLDNDGDGYNDAVEVEIDADTTDGTLYVTVYGYLIDPSGNTVDSCSSIWQISGTAIEYGYLYLYVQSGGPEGYYDVKLYLYDDGGNREDYQYVDDIAYLYPPGYTPDTVPPTGSIVINQGESYTTQTSVILSLTFSDIGSGVDKVRYSNDGIWDTEPWETPTTTKVWELTGGDGVKTVYYQVKDKAGNISPVYSDSITLDTLPPTGSISINNGATYATSTSVTLTLTYIDETSGVNQVRFSNDGVWDTEQWESPSQTRAWILTPGDGIKTVFYQIKDNAGWISITYSDEIILDTTPPTGSIIINADAVNTTSTTVELTLFATDANGIAQMRFSNDGSTWSSWEPYTTSKIWTLTPGYEPKTVYVQFKDNAGLESIPYWDTIEYVIPEYPSIAILLLFMILTGLIVVFAKKRIRIKAPPKP